MEYITKFEDYEKSFHLIELNNDNDNDINNGKDNDIITITEKKIVFVATNTRKDDLYIIVIHILILCLN